MREGSRRSGRFSPMRQGRMGLVACPAATAHGALGSNLRWTRRRRSGLVSLSMFSQGGILDGRRVGGGLGCRRVWTNLAEVTQYSGQSLVLEVGLGRGDAGARRVGADLIDALIVGRGGSGDRVNTWHCGGLRRRWTMGRRQEGKGGRKRCSRTIGGGVDGNIICPGGLAATLVHANCQERKREGERGRKKKVAEVKPKHAAQDRRETWSWTAQRQNAPRQSEDKGGGRR